MYFLKLQKINSIFLVIVLITAAITLGISTFIDDAFALGDNYNKKEFRYINDSYDKEPDDKKYNKYDIKYPKDENFAIVLDNNLNNTTNQQQIQRRQNIALNQQQSMECKMTKYNSYEPEYIEYNNEYKYNPID